MLTTYQNKSKNVAEVLNERALTGLASHESHPLLATPVAPEQESAYRNAKRARSRILPDTVYNSHRRLRFDSE